uniref:DUF38 domain-containing protein n=1 Tax=Panagrolaimus sp. ES5 TaxID=591445 RepID=A0AC34FJM4_9BILA
MDSSDSESTNSTSSVSTLTENSSLIFPSKAEFLKTYRRQSFSLPDSIMHYIAMNPSSAEAYEKLVQSCKYFFVKNSILVLSSLNCFSNGCETLINGEWKDIDLINNPNKLWITDRFNVKFNNDNTSASSIIPKFFHCNVKNLIVWEQIISYDEFMVLTANVERLEFIRATVKYDDGTIVPFEKLVDQLPEAIKIHFFPSGTEMITSKTFKELLKIPRFATLDRLNLYEIPEVFDIASYYVHMKKNKHTKFLLYFCETISDEYKIRIEAIVDEIIDATNHKYKTPLIYFNGLDEEKWRKLHALCRQQ